MKQFWLFATESDQVYRSNITEKNFFISLRVSWSRELFRSLIVMDQEASAARNSATLWGSWCLTNANYSFAYRTGSCSSFMYYATMIMYLGRILLPGSIYRTQILLILRWISEFRSLNSISVYDYYAHDSSSIYWFWQSSLRRWWKYWRKGVRDDYAAAPDRIYSGNFAYLWNSI